MMRGFLRTLSLAGFLHAGLALAVVAQFATPASAQSGQASLIADSVRVEGNSALIAQGNVVVLFEGSRLTASRVVYDKATDSLTITGPITITRPDGTLLVAESATLSADLRDGILNSARLVLNEQLQIAAAQINRVQDRYTQMSKVVASSCQVCKSRPVPLWQIRATRVVHDEKERQLYFHDAQLRVADIPVFYLPRLRLPDPSLKRATGFLPPKIRTNSTIGNGVKAPFFIKLGDHADVTLSPFLTTKTSTLELRYRHAFRFGSFEVEGAISDDKILPGTTRYFVFATGSFALPRDYTLNFQLQETSDPSYLLDYGYSDEDRLKNEITVMRARRDELVFAGITRYNTLRASEIPIADWLPFAQIQIFYEKRLFFENSIGGEATIGASWQGHFRNSTADIRGRDMARLGIEVGWRRDWTTSYGLLFEAETEIDGNVYWINEDSRYVAEQTFATPSAGITLRWPMSRITGSGAVDILEPVAHLAWSEQVGVDIPNEDSVFVEFDEANLFDLSRFPGHDRRETGLRGAVGLTWTRHSPTGWAVTLAAGRVFRDTDFGQFTKASGLSGAQSDWLLGAHVDVASRFALQGRALVDDDLNFTKSETRALYRGDKLQLAAAHIWVIEDREEERPDPTHELRLDTAYQINDYWQVSADGSFDLEAEQATRAGFGLRYANECVSVDLSLSRRFTSSTNVRPTTDIGLQIELTGFGGGSSGGRAHQCSG